MEALRKYLARWRPLARICDPSLAGGAEGVKRTFSQELRELAEEWADRPIALENILEATQGRGFQMLLVFLALPFLTPLPLPGFSIPFGLVVTLIGTRLSLGQRPWLPQKLLKRKLPPRFLQKLIKATGGILRGLEYFLRPRLVWMQDAMLFRRVAGVLIALSGIYMLAPLPIPFSNGLPAWTVLLLAAGALERDGLFFIVGCVSFVVSTGFFLFLGLGGAHLFNALVG